MDDTQTPQQPPVPWEAPPETTPAVAGPDAVRPPLQVGAVIGRSLDAYGSDWSLYLMLALPAAIIAGVGSLVGPGLGPFGVLIVAIVGGLPTTFATIAATFAIDDALTGRAPTVAGVSRRAMSRFPVVLGSYILVGLAIVGLALAVGVAVALVAMTGGGGVILGVFVAVVVVVLAVILLIRWALVGPAATLEPIGPLASLNRSRTVVRGNA